MASIPPEVSHAVDRLLEQVVQAPTRLPLAEMVDLHRAGHDVSVAVPRTETDGARPAVVYVTPRADARLDRLSPREREVAMLAAAGYRNQQIAVALFISLATVKDHMHAILTKTGFVSRGQLIAAWYGGLGSPESE